MAFNEEWVSGLGRCSVSKALAAQTRGPEFGAPAPTFVVQVVKVMHAYYPSTGKAVAGGSLELTNQPA